MSIRSYNKNHLKEHSGVSSVPQVELNAPESTDPLVFWTKHEKEPTEVNLQPFSNGQERSKHKKGGGRAFIPFAGRPKLILQIAPAIEETLSYAVRGTTVSLISALRRWWRILDEVESLALKSGQLMTRVDDVRLITQLHVAYARSSGMDRHTFGNFRALVDTTLMALGERKTYWESPEDLDEQKHIPPKEQRDAVRFAVRSTCRSVLDRWAQYDRLNEIDTKPNDPKEFEMWRDVKFMRYIQKVTEKALPTPKDFKDAIPYWACNPNGNFKLKVRESVFPNHWDADAVWHQCLLNTGWNPSTLTTLNANKTFLFDHFKDDPKDPHSRFVLSQKTYDLVGIKERAGGSEQFVIGQWKTLDGPGHLIKTYLKRVEPLREILKQQLAQELLKYEQMQDADYKERTKQFSLVKTLEQGVHSVWLYVGRRGNISWINDQNSGSVIVDGKSARFMHHIVHLLNTKQAATSAHQAEGKVAQLKSIPHVTPKDFRVWFADYVYRASHGNMLHVKRALNHRRLSTSIGYTDTNILNSEASDSARRFLNVLVGELDGGRIDLTILAHLHRYGQVTPEQEQLLAQARALPKSRMKVACKEARHPPPHMKATNGQDCDVQRCLICQEHAVLLPESLDGIAMRAEELRALQGFLPIETWIAELYDIELKNNLMALRKFDLNQGLAARKKWARAIASGEYYVPGLPMASSLDQMELV